MEQGREVYRRLTWENIGPSVVFGGTCGVAGAIVGSCWALYKPYPKPGLYSFLCFLQYGAYGTVYHGARASYLRVRPLSRSDQSLDSSKDALDNDSLKARYFPKISLRTSPPTVDATRYDLLTYSALAGATSGGLINAIFRGRFILSGGLQFAVFGFLGQRAWLWVDERHSRKIQREHEQQQRLERGETEETLLERIAIMAGMRKMSDEEYIKVLEERALELEAEIALIDERIEAVRREEQQSAERGRQASRTGSPTDED